MNAVKYNMEKKDEIKQFCIERGADFCGIADLESFRGKITVLPGDLIDPFRYAVSIGIKLKNDIINSIDGQPTPEYSRHCRDVNVMLDGIATQLVHWIEEQGGRAKAIPASHWEDPESLLGSISHKAVARMAGLDWQGKSLLLVNSECGPRLRLTTILTDMSQEPDGPVRNQCGRCTACTDACPASAIRNVSTGDHYARREDAVFIDRCYSKLLEFKDMPGIDYTFCGVCIQVCPFGRKGSMGGLNRCRNRSDM